MKSTSNAFYVIIVVCSQLLVFFILGIFVLGEAFSKEERTYADFACSDYSRGWYLVEGDTRTPIDLPAHLELEEGTTEVIIEKKIQRWQDRTAYLSFSSAKQDVVVYVDGKKRYTYNTEKTRRFASFSADIMTFVPIHSSDDEKIIQIVFTGNNNYTGVISEMKVGTQLGIFLNIVQNDIFDLIGAFTLIFMGLQSFSLGIFTKLAYKRQTSIDYLGVAVFFYGFWMIAESSIRQFIVPNFSVLASMTYLSILMMPMFFALYFDGVQKGRYRVFYMLVCMLNIVEAILSLTLFFNRMSDLFNSLIYSFILVLLAVAIYLITVIPDIIKGYVKSYWIEFVGILGGAIAGVMTLIQYLQRPTTVDGVIFGGGLIFVVLMAYIRAFRDVLGLERSVNAAVQAQNASTDFISRMSHQMRTPINAILGMNKMILKESKEPEILEYARDVNSAGNYLLSIVDEVLDLSKVKSGNITLDIQEYDLLELVRECYSLIVPRARASKLAFSVDLDDVLPSHLSGDRGRLVQIITNLLTNAVKFTPEGRVTLIITGKITSGKLMLMISVEDTGIGISENDLPHIFDSYNSKDYDENEDSMRDGIGLQITKRLVELMGGQITAESILGKGSTFSVMIPQGICSVEPVGYFSMGPNGDRRVVSREPAFELTGKILVVDDVAINLKVFSMLLKKTGIIVETAKSGVEALEKISKTKYDIIFLDHLMPSMDGIEVMNKMGEIENNPNANTPVIMQTANAVVGAKETYMGYGFADYIAKPIKEELLMAMLKKYIC